MGEDKSTTSNLLQFALKKLNLSVEDVLKLYDDMKKTEIIKQHVETFSTIWQGTNERWYTYLPDNSKKGRRKLIAKSSEEKLNIEILSYYKRQEAEGTAKHMTLASFYPEWLKYKSLKTTATSYLRRINADWNKYYVDTPIIHKPLRELDKVTLDIWAHELLKSNTLNKTQYYNITVVMNQALDLAVEYTTDR